MDYSKYAIMHMSEAHSAIPQLEYRVADCRCMPEIQVRGGGGERGRGGFAQPTVPSRSWSTAWPTAAACLRSRREGGGRMVEGGGGGDYVESVTVASRSKVVDYRCVSEIRVS